MNRRLLPILLFSLLGASLSAQQYPFIRSEANVLCYDSSSTSMRTFLDKWQQVQHQGHGNINIVHIGGSHVQAGTFPHRVRTRLLNDNPRLVGGRGMIFPYSAAPRCNNPHDYIVHCPEPVRLTRNVQHEPTQSLGLCGIAVTAHDVATHIQMHTNDRSIDYNTTRIVILGNSPDGVVPSIYYDDHSTLPSYVDLEHHRYVFNLMHPVDTFTVILPCQQGETFTLTGVLLGSRKTGITYHSIGVNGAAVRDFLKCPDLTSDLRMVHPDLVVFGIGINDATASPFDTVAFFNRYKQLCDSIRSVNPQCAFIFVTNNDSYRRTGRKHYAVNSNGLLAREVFYRLAHATGGAVWDQFEVMGGLRSMAQWQKAGLAQRDKVHFTHSGYLLIGDLFYEALNRELQGSHAPVELPDTPAEVKTNDRSAVVSNKPAIVNNSNPTERPLPRGLRRKSSKSAPTPAVASPAATPSAQPAHSPTPKTAKGTPQQNSKNSSNISHDSDRFPYISQ